MANKNLGEVSSVLSMLMGNSVIIEIDGGIRRISLQNFLDSFVEIPPGTDLAVLSSKVDRIKQTLGHYSKRNDITLTASETGVAISADGAKVTKDGWAIAEFTAEKGVEYLFKPVTIDGDVCIFAQKVTSKEIRSIDYTYTFNEKGLYDTAVAVYNGETHTYTYAYTYDEPGEAVTSTTITDASGNVVETLPYQYETTIGTYVPLTRLNASAELPEDGYCRLMSHFQGNAALTVVVSYKVDSADLTMQVVKDGVLASIATQLGNLSQNISNVSEALSSRISHVESTTKTLEAVDLSYRDIFGNYVAKRNTANCYVVKANGLYKLPLVYGNGIKDGVVNSAAYTKIEDTAGNVADFVNHLGNVITTPYIEEMAGCKAVKGCVAWCEAQDVITDLQIVEGSNGLRELLFNVQNFPSKGANAVIGILDSEGNFIWSWHIWLYADELTTIEFTNHTEVVYNLLNVNLGWSWDDDEKTAGKCVQYQWGRKDAMLSPASASSASNHAAYGEKTFGVLDVAEEKTVANAICKPYLFFKQYDEVNYNWNNLEAFYNFWDASCKATGASDNVTVKTIYDPSPVGFKVPAGRAFTGFTTTGAYTTDKTQFNVVGDFAKGWYFKANADDAVGKFFPASGCRLRTSGGLSNVGGYGYYWSAAAVSRASAYDLYFYASLVNPLDYYDRALGFSVRAVRE